MSDNASLVLSYHRQCPTADFGTPIKAYYVAQRHHHTGSGLGAISITVPSSINNYKSSGEHLNTSSTA